MPHRSFGRLCPFCGSERRSLRIAWNAFTDIRWVQRKIIDACIAYYFWRDGLRALLTTVAKILGVIVVGALLLLTVLSAVTSFGKDPMNRHGRGPGWECTSFGRGSYACDKDVIEPKPDSRPKSMKRGS